jgi:hypothetical protein
MTYVRSSANVKGGGFSSLCDMRTALILESFLILRPHPKIWIAACQVSSPYLFKVSLEPPDPCSKRLMDVLPKDRATCPYAPSPAEPLPADLKAVKQIKAYLRGWSRVHGVLARKSRCEQPSICTQVPLHAGTSSAPAPVTTTALERDLERRHLASSFM